MKNKKWRKSFIKKFIFELNKNHKSNFICDNKIFLNFQPKLHYKYHKIFLFYFIIILLTISLSEQKLIKLKKIDNAYDIYLRVKEGEQKLYNEQYFSPIVLYKGSIIYPDQYGYYSLSETEENNIILRWEENPPTNFYKIFDERRNILYANFENFDLSQVTSISNMFNYCNELTSVDFTNINTESLVEMDSMFYECNSLKSLDLSYFNTEHVTNLNYIFFGCSSLTSINFGNFDTSSVLDMSKMFYGCSSLTSLDLKNFNTQRVKNTNSMFNGCSSLLYLDLSNFQTTLNTDMQYMFSGCSSLISLNIDNFNAYSSPEIRGMFAECGSLISLKFDNFKINLSYSSSDLEDFFHQINNNMKYCFNDDNTTLNTLLQRYPDSLFMTKVNCSDICFNENKKIINDTKTCTLSCAEEELDKYEYNDICYRDCPAGTIKSENLCIIENQNEESTLILESDSDTNASWENFDGNSIFDNFCLLNNDYSIDNINKIINNIKTDSMACKLDLFNSFEKDKNDIYIKDNNIIYHITSSFNQKNNEYNNISSINLGECETKLKESYGINDDKSLIIFKMELQETSYSIPIVEYEVYNLQTKDYKLNLSLCEGLKIMINIPVDIDEDNLFKYNSSSEYYNDKCFPYTTVTNTDIILEDRRKEYINNNLSLCENNCEYSSYNSKNKKVACKCFIKKKFTSLDDIKIDSSKFLKNFKNIKEKINLEVVKCYKLLFTKKGIKYNLGNYIIISIILSEIVLLILFKIKGYKKLLDKINEIINCKKEEENNNVINENKIMEDNKKYKIKKIIKKKKKKKKKINIDNDIKIYPNENNNPPKKERKESVNRIKINRENSKKTTSKLFISKDNMVFNNQKNDIILNNKNVIDNKSIEEYNDYELNSLNYEKALEIDKRTYCQYYFSLLKVKHLLIFTFYTNTDYNSRIIKLSLFIFSFALFLTINALFFTDSTMHKIYENHGIFNFVYQLPKILYSTIISAIINAIVKFLSLSEKNILQIKNEKTNVDIISMKIIKKLKIKLLLFYILIILFLLFFWFYLSCFCAVYTNTQYHLIKDTLISFGLSLIYPFGINLLPGIFRISSLSDQNKSKKYIYIISKVIQIF